MSSVALYPPAPRNVPGEVTQLDPAYRGRVITMIASLFFFLVLYLLFVAAAGLLAYWLIMLPVPETGSGRGIGMLLIFKFGGALAAILLCLFLFKGLFKGQRVERSQYVKLNERDQPQLFAFIRQLCKDTGAPLPRYVYVDPEVNAALVYNTSLINLFVPPKKDLLIGLGLVNVVNLSEFKAVLAHEFGHFAQRSVGLGSYLHVANRVMHDIIYSRDGLDQFVDHWASIDIRISFPALGLKGVLWVIRKILGGVFEGMNVIHLSLSREMEFNADNVAVRMAGSDAIIHALSRLDFASECLADAARSLNHAADHGLFSDDLFHHQTQSAARLRKLRKDDRLGLPPALPADATEQVQVFEPEEDGIPEKYRSHPTNDMRERNAKRIYVRSQFDDRSPWLIFDNAAALKRAATQHFYEVALERHEEYAPESAESVQQFLDAEHAETTYDPCYHGLYDDRFINPGELGGQETPWSRAQVEQFLSSWLGDGLQKRVEDYCRRRAEYDLLQGLKSGDLSLKGKTFEFRSQEHTARDVETLFAQVDKELDADLDDLHKLDRQVFLAHAGLARLLDEGDGGTRAREFAERYRFHMELQALLTKMLGDQARLHSMLNYLSDVEELTPEDFKEVKDCLREIYTTMADELEQSHNKPTPAMTNVPAGTPLHTLIADRGDTAMPRMPADQITGEWIGKLARRQDGVLDRVKRVHFKSLGSLLAFQQKLSAAFKPTAAPVPPAPPVAATPE